MIGKKETVLLSAIILASIVAVPYMASSSFADSKIKSKVNFHCTYENSGNGDNIPIFGTLTGSTLPITGPGGAGGAGGTSGNPNDNDASIGSNSNENDNSNGASTATGGSGGSNSMGDESIEQAEANIDERNPCIFELNVISVDSH